MHKEITFVLNDLADAVERLTKVAEETNPGATEDIRYVRFLLERIDRSLKEIP